MSLARLFSSEFCKFLFKKTKSVEHLPTATSEPSWRKNFWQKLMFSSRNENWKNSHVFITIFKLGGEKQAEVAFCSALEYNYFSF